MQYIHDPENEGHIWKGRKIPKLRVNRDNPEKNPFLIQRVTIPHILTMGIVKSGDFLKSLACEISGFKCEPHPAFSYPFTSYPCA